MTARLKNILRVLFILVSITGQEYAVSQEPDIITGAQRTEVYIPKLAGRKIAVTVNHTSLIGSTHIVDSLLSLGINVARIFSPEHGFKGKAEAGEYYADSISSVNDIRIISLYGKKRKPSPVDLEGIDIIVYDIQDIGVRFYTYISTLHYIMEACAGNDIPLLILDRPNPNGHYIDGPVLDIKYKSFVGIHTVPVVHGMTTGEYALMINGEGWLDKKKTCRLEVVTCENYKHTSFYILPENPSPNIRNMRSVYLYPSLCFFEGTIMNEGRGTGYPFQVYGHPDFKDSDFSYIPGTIPGAVNPRHKDVKCYGVDLRDIPLETLQSEARINLSYVIGAYQNMQKGDQFFNSYFNNLAGNDILRKQITDGLSEEQIRDSWQENLEYFRKIRKKYLLYPDFE